ncbi:hypothetical protein acdb102_39160 [Acidothermaceae bacterium B102]|nr:hypothetical protein acdb102_39160 [Acidothermaceae bacterium B102]
MSDWINLHAIGNILWVGLLLGAGLPALFAVGLLALDYDETDAAVAAGTAAVTRNPVRVAAAGLCFAVVLAAVAYGIYFIVNG